MSPAAYPLDCKNKLKRRHTPDAPADCNPPLNCAKRACPHLPQGKDDNGEDIDSLSWLDESEPAGSRSWLDHVDERAVCAMMCSLVHDIGSSQVQQYAEDSSSSSSCPLVDIARSKSCAASESAGDDEGESHDEGESQAVQERMSESGSSTADEEIQPWPQQAEDKFSVLSCFWPNWDTYSSGGNSDIHDNMGAVSGVCAANEDEFSGPVVYGASIWLDPCFDVIALEPACT